MTWLYAPVFGLAVVSAMTLWDDRGKSGKHVRRTRLLKGSRADWQFRLMAAVTVYAVAIRTYAPAPQALVAENLAILIGVAYAYAEWQRRREGKRLP